MRDGTSEQRGFRTFKKAGVLTRTHKTRGLLWAGCKICGADMERYAHNRYVHSTKEKEEACKTLCAILWGARG